MKAIILAAGRGSRLKALTQEKPKCMTEIDGKPLLYWQIDSLKGAGVPEVGVVCGYMKEKIVAENTRFFENTRWQQTNMLSSLICAEEWLKNDTCLVSYSDILYPSSTILKLLEAKGDIVISYNTEWLKVWQARFDDPLSDAETFRTDDKGFLTEIGGKAQSLDEIKGQYMGLLKFTPRGWRFVEEVIRDLPELIDKMDMTSLLNRMIGNGVKISTIPIDGEWFEFDSEADIKAYQKMSPGFVNYKFC